MRSLIVSLVAGFFLVLPMGGAAHAKACDLPAYPSPNGTYTDTVTAKRLGCADAYKVMTKYWKCRTKTGPEGRCVSLVSHFACREERYSDFYSDSFQATATCAKGKKKLVFSYTQSKALA